MSVASTLPMLGEAQARSDVTFLRDCRCHGTRGIRHAWVVPCGDAKFGGGELPVSQRRRLPLPETVPSTPTSSAPSFTTSKSPVPKKLVLGGRAIHRTRCFVPSILRARLRRNPLHELFKGTNSSYRSVRHLARMSRGRWGREPPSQPRRGRLRNASPRGSHLAAARKVPKCATGSGPARRPNYTCGAFNLEH